MRVRMARKKDELSERPLDQLRPHPSQARLFNEATDAEFENLVADIREHGLQHRVEITPESVIICGHRRVRALRLLGEEMVPVVIRHGLAARGEGAVRRWLTADNLFRRQLAPLGKVRCYVELLEELARDKNCRGPSAMEEGELRDRLGKILNQSGRNVARYLAVARLPMPIQRAFDAGELTLVQAARVGGLGPEAQEQIAAAITHGTPARDAVAAHLSAGDGRHQRALGALAAFVRALD